VVASFAVGFQNVATISCNHAAVTEVSFLLARFDDCSKTWSWRFPAAMTPSFGLPEIHHYTI
jgi:hypothetical protein